MDSWRTEALTQSTAPVTSVGQSFRALSHEQPNALPRIERDALDRSDVSLSARERGIVALMSHGLSNKQIARKLSIAPETVKSHAKHIFVKLTVCSRAQAVYRAATLGLIALQ
jgi:ATP/maltotriose-dependent transcriptional regulator MalT